MQLPGRGYVGNTYRYGFNGQEKDDEIKGSGNSYTAEFWQYDSRLGRRWNIDPVVKPNESSYLSFGGNPIWNVDPKGDDWYKNNKTGAVVWRETNNGRDYEGYTYLGEHRYWNNFFTKGHYEYFNLFGRGNELWLADNYMFGHDDPALAGGKLGGKHGFHNGGKQLIVNTVITIATFGVGELYLGGKALWYSISWETSKEVIAARGDMSKVDWFDVVMGVASKKFGLGPLVEEGANAIIDAKIEDQSIRVAFYNKEKSAVFMDITFGSFKALVGKVYNETHGTDASQLSEESMKMLFDQLKTEISQQAEKNKK